MSLDIISLLLTDEALEHIEEYAHPDDQGDYTPLRVADAQLKKALWGVQMWLEEDTCRPCAKYLSAYLRDQLLAADMSRPEDVVAS